MILPKCEVCGSKKEKFIKEQEATRLISNLGIKAPLSKIPIVSPGINRLKSKYDGYQRGIASVVYTFFDKKTTDVAVKYEIMQNKELAGK